MTTKELYERIGADYDAALRRLPTDDLVAKFIVRFLDDTSCQRLIDVWEAKNEGEMFEAAHAAKGVCANLALTKLYENASIITDAYRPGKEELREKTDVDALMKQFKEDYENSVREINVFNGEK
ncbi:MAG: Hpt domain-containing protein [Lachnospiraceae bacterium]|nr:Hpt domain-containing protein [Lachnospiraceae bacterium]